MKKILNLFSGRKTYLVCIAMIVYVILGYALNKGLDVELLLEALALAGIRAGIK